jgi:hypothetical protein
MDTFRVRDGVLSGLAVVLTVFKVWLAAALLLTIAASVAGEGLLVAIVALTLVVACLAPFIRWRWFGELRDGLRDDRFRAGLVMALVLSVLGLWGAMMLLAATGSELAPGGRAQVPDGLNAAVGILVVTSTVLGGIALYRLQRRQALASEWR